MFLGVPIIKHIVMRLYSAQILGHLKIMNFPFGTNGKFIILGVPILKYFRVVLNESYSFISEYLPLTSIFSYQNYF